MKIEVDLPTMAKLFVNGALSPSDVRCLDEQSKQDLKKLCLELCKPSKCASCDAQKYCSQPFSEEIANVFSTGNELNL